MFLTNVNPPCLVECVISIGGINNDENFFFIKKFSQKITFVGKYSLKIDFYTCGKT